MPRKVLESQISLETPYFKVLREKYETADGRIIDPYYVIERSDVAVVLATTKDNKVILLEQYRHPIKKIGIEVPAGHIDPGETPEEGAKRELLEETGYQAKKLTKVFEAYSAIGLLKQKLHFFIAEDAEKVTEPNLDENEELEVLIKTWDETIELLNQGAIHDVDSALAIRLAQIHHG